MDGEPSSPWPLGYMVAIRIDDTRGALTQSLYTAAAGFCMRGLGSPLGWVRKTNPKWGGFLWLGDERLGGPGGPLFIAIPVFFTEFFFAVNSILTCEWRYIRHLTG